MARPVKATLEYFPMDIDFFQDLKVRKLKRFQGGKAVTVYAALLCIIYRDGYYTKWDEDMAFVLSEITNYEQTKYPLDDLPQLVSATYHNSL